MRFGKIGMAAVAASALVATPVLAQAVQPVSKASEAVRANASTDNEEKLAGGSGIIIAVLAAAAVIGGIIVAADGSDDDPTSP